MHIHKYLLVLGVFIFFLFSLLSFLVSRDIFDRIDFDITVRLQDNLPDRVIDVFSSFSLLGSAEATGIILLIILFLLKVPRKIFIIGAFLMTGVIELLGKMTIEHHGPPVLLLKTKLAIHFPTSYIPHEFYAYPSGHSARTIFVSLILIFAIWRMKNIKQEIKIALILIVLFIDLIMLVSRVYLGEHWTTDVIGGVLLGSSLAFLALSLLPKLKIVSKTNN